MSFVSTGNSKVTTQVGGPQQTATTPVSGEDVYGAQIVSTGTQTLGTGLVTPGLSNIDTYHGLPLTALHFALTVQVTAGGTTIPGGIQVIENALKKFSLKSINGQFGEPIINLDGTYLAFTRIQRLKNPYGFYVTSPLGTMTTSGSTTNTWNFDLYYTIKPELFPLRCEVAFNTLGALATTGNGITGSATLTVSADYTSMNAAGQPAMSDRRTRMKILPFTESSTGTPALASFWDKQVTAVQQAVDFGADSNLTNTNCFNMSLQGQQIFTNKPYQDLINAENAKLPGVANGHISGFFPLRVADLKPSRYIDNSLNFSASISSAPYANSSTGPNSYTNTAVLYLEEVF